MDYNDFKNKYLGQSKGYPDGYYVGQCLSIVKLYIKEVLGLDNPPSSGVGSAYGYWTRFPSPLNTVLEKVENTPDLIPERGWIAVWNKSSAMPYGHIAMVDDGSTKSVLVNSAQNWTSKTYQIERNNYNNVAGFLKPINKPEPIKPEPEISEDEKRALGILSNFKSGTDEFKNGNLEGCINGLIGSYTDKKKQIAKKDKQIESLNVLSKNLSETVTKLSSKDTKNQKIIVTCQTTIKTANKLLQTNDFFNKNLQNELEIMTADRNRYKKLYETKNSSYNELLTENEIGVLKGIWLKLKNLFIK